MGEGRGGKEGGSVGGIYELLFDLLESQHRQNPLFCDTPSRSGI